MNKKNEKTLQFTWALVSVTLPALIFTIATFFTDMFPGYGHPFIFGDSLLQFSIFSKEFMRRLFSGESLIYSFENGMGMPTVAINAFYSQSPFNILYLVINDIETASFFIVISKLIVSSLCMYLLICRLIKIPYGASAFFSTAYSLCSFFAFFYVSLELLDMLYIMPLIILGLIRFLKQDKWGLLCVTYTYSFVIHFYSAYITGIFSFIVFLVYSWYLFGKTSVLWKKAIWGYFKCVLVAVLIASPLLIPAGYELILMRTTDADKLKNFVLYPWNFVAGFYPAQFSEFFNSIPYAYAGIPTILLTVFFFFDANISKRKKILAIIPIIYLVLCSFIKTLYLFMHAFDAPNGYAFRFSWLFCFCMVLIAAKEYENFYIKGLPHRNICIIITGIWFFLYVLLYFIPQELNPVAPNIHLKGILLLFCITLLYIIAMKHYKNSVFSKIVLFVLLSTELTANLMQCQNIVSNQPPDRYEYTIAGLQAENCLNELHKYESKDPWVFYRLHYLNSFTDNISMTYDFHGIGWFCSIENENIRHTLNKLGYAATNLLTYDYGSTPLMQMLFAQKYSMECGYLNSEQAQYYTFKKNDFTLPLGYMVSSEMLNYHIDVASPFDAQNSLVSAMCGRRHRIYAPYDGMCCVSTNNTELISYDDGTKVRLTGDFGQVEYAILPNPTGKTYAYMYRWGISESTSNSPLIRSKTDIGGMNCLSNISLPHIFELSPDSDGLCRLYIAMNSGEASAFDYETIFFAYENADEIASVYSDLAPGAMTVTSFRDDRIEATVTATSDKPLLFTTIPYDKSWHVYCDGTELVTHPVLDDAFLGVMLEEGTHDIRFEYKSRWVYIGRAVGVVGIILFLFTISRTSKPGYHRYR